MNPPKCRNCGKVEWGHICSGGIVEVRKAIEKVKPFKESVKKAEKVPAADVVKRAEGALDPDGMTANRRKRADYNAYMREYRRARRKKGIAL